jgi:hypothetical protein
MPSKTWEQRQRERDDAIRNEAVRNGEHFRLHILTTAAGQLQYAHYFATLEEALAKIKVLADSMGPEPQISVSDYHERSAKIDWAEWSVEQLTQGKWCAVPGTTTKRITGCEFHDGGDPSPGGQRYDWH